MSINLQRKPIYLFTQQRFDIGEPLSDETRLAKQGYSRLSKIKEFEEYTETLGPCDPITIDPNTLY